MLQVKQSADVRSLEGTALILDFGSVISYSIFERHAQTEARLGLPAGSIAWWGPLKPEEDPLWCDMLADELSEREYWERLAQEIGNRVGEDWTPAQFLKAARSEDLNDEIRPHTISLVETARANGARLAILSNELELFYGAEALAEIDLLKSFDVIVDATHTNILKPDRRAYEMVMEQIGVPASVAVFLDDQPRNVAGGQAAGLTSLLFDVRDPEGSCDRALTMLGALAKATL